MIRNIKVTTAPSHKAVNPVFNPGEGTGKKSKSAYVDFKVYNVFDMRSRATKYFNVSYCNFSYLAHLIVLISFNYFGATSGGFRRFWENQEIQDGEVRKS